MGRSLSVFGPWYVLLYPALCILPSHPRLSCFMLLDKAPDFGWFHTNSLSDVDRSYFTTIY